MKTKNIGVIEVVKIKENKNGTANVTFEYNKIFEENLRKSLGLKKITKNIIRKTILDALNEAVRKDK